jgi:hypothetical protein
MLGASTTKAYDEVQNVKLRKTGAGVSQRAIAAEKRQRARADQ